jgi:hypothetical protein
MEREISIPQPVEKVKIGLTRRAFVRRSAFTLAGTLAGVTGIPALYSLEQSAREKAAHDHALTQATGFSSQQREEVLDCSKPVGTRHDTLTNQDHCDTPVMDTPYPVALEQIRAAENLPDILRLQQQATRKYIRGAGGLGLTAVFALCAIALKKTDSEETL